MIQEKMMLAALAEIGALRNVMVQAIALRLLDEADPVQTLGIMQTTLAAAQTMPADTGGALDPAMSDHLAALTDDRTRALLGEVQQRLEQFIGQY